MRKFGRRRTTSRKSDLVVDDVVLGADDDAEDADDHYFLDDDTHHSKLSKIPSSSTAHLSKVGSLITTATTATSTSQNLLLHRLRMSNKNLAATASSPSSFSSQPYNNNNSNLMAITTFGRLERQRRLDEARHSNYASSIRTLRLLARQQQAAASEKLLLKAYFDLNTGLPPIRRLLVEILLSDEPDICAAYSIFAELENEFILSEQKSPAASGASSAMEAVKVHRKRKLAFLTKQCAVCAFLARPCVRDRELNATMLARLIRESLSTTFAQTVAVLSRTSNLLLTRMLLEHLWDVCGKGPKPHLESFHQRQQQEANRNVSLSTENNNSSSSTTTMKYCYPARVDLGYESFSVFMMKNENIASADGKKHHNKSHHNQIDKKSSRGRSTSPTTAKSQRRKLTAQDPYDIGAESLEGNLFPVLDLFHKNAASNHHHPYRRNNNSNSNNNFSKKYHHNISLAQESTTASSLLQAEELELLEKLFRTYRVSKRFGCAILLLMLFPELEPALPPNDFDPFRSESDAWKRENFERFYVNPREKEILLKKEQQRRRKSHEEQQQQQQQDVDDRKDLYPEEEEDASGNQNSLLEEQYFQQNSKFFKNNEVFSSSFRDESSVIEKLLNDSLWLSRFGSPFVEYEKNFFEDVEFREI